MTDFRRQVYIGRQLNVRYVFRQYETSVLFVIDPGAGGIRVYGAVHQ
jgi:hypothetical protein